MATKNNELGMFTFDKIKDEFIGEIGTEKKNTLRTGIAA